MIFVPKDDLDDPDWSAIVEEGTRQREAHIASFNRRKPFKISDGLYKRYMRYLLTLFGGKCAYCETKIDSNQPGDVEHFRPKGRVVDEDFNPVKIDHPQLGLIDHPGYFWLAYDWSNLLPSCIDCNRYRKHGKVTKAGAGKADRFPVEGFRARAPGEEKDEHALLIDPARMNPDDHLEFHEDGSVSPKTEEGLRTIKLFGLNLREGLADARRLAMENASDFAEVHWSAVISNNQERLARDEARLAEIREGRGPYTAMQRLGIARVTARIRQEQQRFG